MVLAIVHVTKWLGMAVELNIDSSRPFDYMQSSDNVAIGIHDDAGTGSVLLGKDLDLGFSIVFRERFIAHHFYVNDGRKDFSGHLFKRRIQTPQHVYI